MVYFLLKKKKNYGIFNNIFFIYIEQYYNYVSKIFLLNYVFQIYI